MYEYRQEFCSKLKAEHYIKCVKTLYNWSFEPEETILDYINNLGLNDYQNAILSLMQHKAHLDTHINFILSYLQDFEKHEDRIDSLNELKIILLVCNKNQAIRIYSIVTRTAQDIKQDLSILETF